VQFRTDATQSSAGQPCFTGRFLFKEDDMYLDPGFGSMVIQLALGAIAASGAFFFMFREKIKKLFGVSTAKGGNGESVAELDASAEDQLNEKRPNSIYDKP
jgi:hypothetical protein